MPLPQRLQRYHRLSRYWSTIGWNLASPNRSRSIFVLGHPRTGTNWFCRIVAHYFDLPIYMPRLYRGVPLHPVVLHLHRFAIAPPRTVYTLRDGRDVVVSYYYKVLSSLPRTRSLVSRLEQRLPRPMERENIRENLPSFIHFLLAENRATSIPWPEHARLARRRGLLTVRFENLLADPEPEIARAVEFLTGAPPDAERVRAAAGATSFEHRTGRRRGEENLQAPSVRKGIAGDWRNHFSAEAARAFDELAGDALIELGYERDRGWVETVRDAVPVREPQRQPGASA